MTTKFNITVQAGANLQFSIKALNADRTVKDLTGYLGRMQIRATPGGAVLLDVTAYITINGPGGVVTVNVPATLTSGLLWNTGYYDLEIYTSTTNVIRLAEGFATYSPEVTQ